ncbi:hypothetical protein FJTKL_00491 [Diaporthe vaccinii]|uniref:Uncharacterized protein n=1 Tax=Diaporthe vaccinii TaxID=105482 RepID=A0ABR4E2N0_9PEZI
MTYPGKRILRAPSKRGATTPSRHFAARFRAQRSEDELTPGPPLSSSRSFGPHPPLRSKAPNSPSDI